MTCPLCSGTTSVIDSRPEDDQTIRQRECQECGHRFDTIEVDLDLYERLSSPGAVHMDRHALAHYGVGERALEEMRRTLRAAFRK